MGGTLYAAVGGSGGMDDSVLRDWDPGSNYDDDGNITSKSRDTQQKQADAAWKEVQRKVKQLTGKTLTEADRSTWHYSIQRLHGDYQTILREGLRMFGCGG